MTKLLAPVLAVFLGVAFTAPAFSAEAAPLVVDAKKDAKKDVKKVDVKKDVKKK